MRYAEFETLIKAGETKHIDRKIECHAFESKHVESAKAKAELAKDICAMAVALAIYLLAFLTKGITSNQSAITD
jgi:hypothetical protein